MFSFIPKTQQQSTGGHRPPFKPVDTGVAEDPMRPLAAATAPTFHESPGGTEWDGFETAYPYEDDGTEKDDRVEETGEEEQEEEETEPARVNDQDEEGPQGGPWKVDYKKLASEKVNAAMEAYKEHGKTLFDAIADFVQVANEVHAEWRQLQEAEHVETERLDTLEQKIAGVTGNESSDSSDGSS